jgi:hypothetical protein
MKFIGIDPGCSGGICVIDSFNARNIVTLELNKYELSDVADYFRDLRLNEEQCTVYLENPSLPPTNIKRKSGTGANLQGYTKLYRSIGQLEGVLYAFGYPPTLLNPRSWMSRLGVLTGGDKRVTLNEAIKLFPFYAKREGVTKVTHSLADAMLIALLCYLDHTEPKYIIGEFKYARYISHKSSKLSKRTGHNDITSSNKGRNTKDSVSSPNLRPPKRAANLEQLFGSNE